MPMKKISRTVGFTLFALLFFPGCPRPTPGPSPVPPVTVDALTAPDARKTYTCGDACAHLRALKCKMGNPTPRGATCEEVCDNVQGSGLASWNLGCIAAVKQCADVDSCPTSH